MFSLTREPDSLAPQRPCSRRGGPVHVREVLPEALERLSQGRLRHGDLGDAEGTARHEPRWPQAA